MKATTVTTALITIAISLAASACGSSSPAGKTRAHADIPANATTVAAATTAVPTTTVPTTTIPITTIPITTIPIAPTVERPSQLVDEIVSIRDGRMHLRCIGSGAETVVLISGWDDGGDKWGAIGTARDRVCSYARFGTGTSDPPPSAQTFDTQVADLHELLAAAGEPGPYVVLGHSFGGAEAVTFAAKYADEVKGLMLLDASPTSWPATVCSVAAYEAGCAIMHDPTLDPERLDVFPAFDEYVSITSLGDIPMTVMTAAHGTIRRFAQSELDRLNTLVRGPRARSRWASLSSSSSIVSVEHTGHHIELDQPQLVVQELVKLLP